MEAREPIDPWSRVGVAPIVTRDSEEGDSACERESIRAKDPRFSCVVAKVSQDGSERWEAQRGFNQLDGAVSVAITL